MLVYCCDSFLTHSVRGCAAAWSWDRALSLETNNAAVIGIPFSGYQAVVSFCKIYGYFNLNCGYHPQLFVLLPTDFI